MEGIKLCGRCEAEGLGGCGGCHLEKCLASGSATRIKRGGFGNAERDNALAQKKETVLEEADRLVSSDRGNTYGPPIDDFGKVTGAAKALGIDPVSGGAEHHALYMVLVKLARLTATPGHHDSIVDAAGYLKTYDMVIQEKIKRLT